MKPGSDATKPGSDATKPGSDATKPGSDATKMHNVSKFLPLFCWLSSLNLPYFQF